MRQPLWFVVIASVGCGGGGVPGTSPDSAPPPPVADAASSDGAPAIDGAQPGSPRVVATQPADDATDVEPTVTVSATFSSEMAPGSLDASTFAVSQDGAAVAGTVAYDAASRTATFTPAIRLALRGQLVARVEHATDTAGTAVEPAEWSFSVRDGQWDAAAQLGAAAVDFAPSVDAAMDRTGVATAVWEDGGVWFAGRAPGGSWSSATRLADGGSPVIAVDPDGTATVTWQLASEDGIRHLWGARRPAGGTWDTPVRIDTDDGYPHHVGYIDDLAADAAGDVIALWSQADTDGGYRVRARRFVPSAGWGAVAELGHGINPSLAIAPDGRAVAGWMGGEGNGAWSTMWGAVFDPDTGWSAPTQLDPGTANAYLARVAIQPDGRAMLVWLRESGAPASVWAAAFTPASGWSTPVLLEDLPTQAYDAGVVALPGGAFTAIWARFDGGASVRSRRFEPDGGWQAMTVIRQGGAVCRIAADRRGNALVLWQEGGEMWASRGAPDGTWAAPVHIDSPTSGDSFFPTVVVSPLGTAVAVWARSVGPVQSGSSYAPFGAAFD